MTEVLLYEALPHELREQIDNGVTRCRCPRCDGGASREFSLDVRQADTGVLKLKCYRASCSWFGISITEPNAVLQRKSVKPPSVYRNPTIPIQGDIQGKLVNDYGLSLEQAREHGWRLSEHGTELVMPVRDSYGNVRGHVTRTFGKPKRCFTYKETAQPWLDFWGGCEGAATVIVEDCISACRLASVGLNAVALLGTSMTVDQAKEIAEVGKGADIWLALDNDAFEKSLHMAQRHAHVIQMKPVYLTRDIKNMEHDEDIKDLFNGRV